MPTYQYCSVARDGHLTIITLNRPEVMNSLHYEADLELQSVWDDFAADPDQWVAIVTGAGDRAFCTGNDLKAHAAKDTAREFPPGGFAGLTRRFNLDKPVIAAVNGIAMGGGFELALACDVIIAAENAFFALSEPLVGLAPIAGGVQYLPRAIGMPRAMGILLTGRRVPAREAMELGILTAMAPASGALEEARKWAAQMLACSPSALRAIKEVARKTLLDTNFEQNFLEARQFPAVQRMYAGEDYREGPRAFAEKRKPQWTNK
ncbi:MAG: enoyl-CoA hydratase-related protein [Polaromonas sp.]|uniref:enoyl-CoA hydratase-related protein n=1 Tax=Polaromonas sp. TaxID=1869339 RepID=UPI002488C75C|nr:enoyl-CoA hydratase-related protein [Polaromonas sp.]MDI1240001.1 enoyl-CoA hydratase-related protein [Polaromonas sp.]